MCHIRKSLVRTLINPARELNLILNDQTRGDVFNVVRARGHDPSRFRITFCGHECNKCLLLLTTCAFFSLIRNIYKRNLWMATRKKVLQCEKNLLIQSVFAVETSRMSMKKDPSLSSTRLELENNSKIKKITTWCFQVPSQYQHPRRYWVSCFARSIYTSLKTDIKKWRIDAWNAWSMRQKTTPSLQKKGEKGETNSMNPLNYCIDRNAG